VEAVNKKVEDEMPVNVEVRPRNNESPERMIKRFNKKVKRSGVLEEVRDRRFHEKPSKIRRLKKQRAKRLARKAQREYEARFKD
jgi:ribosomal protein S21